MSIENSNGIYNKDNTKMGYKGTTPILPPEMCVPYIPYIPPIELSSETKNKLWKLAQTEANSSGLQQQIWIWSVKSPYECSYAICPADDEEAIYSQDPSNHLLSTVYPIPNPIHPPIRNNQ